MKKFISRIALFAIIVATIDFAFGCVMDYMHEHPKGGGIAKRQYVVHEAEEDILMFGSSRMNHHYNPMIIEDSLGVTCFNAGQDGNGVIMSYGFLNMILERYTPKLIIYDVSLFDFVEDDNMKHISLLKPYYADTLVKNIITDISPMDKYKMYSSIYRYNSLTIRVIGSFFSSSSEYQKGYLPLSNSMDYDVDPQAEEMPVIDDVKTKYLRKFIMLCKENKIPVVFTLSPLYKAYDSSIYNEVKSIVSELDVPFIDNLSNPDFSLNRSYFQDQVHMNSKGADKYTRLLIPELKKYISKNTGN